MREPQMTPMTQMNSNEGEWGVPHAKPRVALFAVVVPLAGPRGAGYCSYRSRGAYSKWRLPSFRIPEIHIGVLDRTRACLPYGLVREHALVDRDPISTKEDGGCADGAIVVQLSLRVRLERDVQPCRCHNGGVMEWRPPAIISAEGDVVLHMHTEHQLGHVVARYEGCFARVVERCVHTFEAVIEPDRHPEGERDTQACSSNEWFQGSGAGEHMVNDLDQQENGRVGDDDEGPTA